MRRVLITSLVSIILLLIVGGEAGATSLIPRLKLDEALVSATPQPVQVKSEKSLALAVTLAIIPGFGAGHFYAGDITRGISFAVVDTFVTGTVVTVCILHYTSMVPTFMKVAIIIFPILLCVERGLQAWSAAKTVEVENNREFKPSREADSRFLPGLTTIARF
jgi:TM2 domain-containing membrane protein YozV